MAYRGSGLVRDKDGNPKVDDPERLPPELVMMLTEAEKTALGVWTGPLVRDAEGVKRLTKEYLVVDDLVAANVLHELDGTIKRLSPRVSLKAGETLGEI